ncbi:MAG: SDR family oxidoreductase [Zestosphaera sp.]
MNNLVEGLKVLVTASTKGIGRGIAEVLLEQGAHVVINGREESAVNEVLSKLRGRFDGRIHGVVADLTVKADVERLVDEAVALMGGLDSLVYVTGPPRPGMFKDLTDDDWENGVKLLILNAVWLVNKALTHLRRSTNPSILFLTSTTVREPEPDLVLSNVLRISVHGLMKTLVRELGPESIRVNAIIPGFIETDRLRSVFKNRALREGKTYEEVYREYAQNIPLRRVGRPEEVGWLAAFLLSRYASYIHGASIPVDGGRLRSHF